MMSYAQWGNELYSGKRSYNIVKHSRAFLLSGIILIIISLLLVGFRGLNQSIEFTGGTQFIVSNTSDADETIGEGILGDQGVNQGIRATTVAGNSVRIQTPTLDTDQAEQARSALATAYDVPTEDVQVNSVGASWGQDVARKALQSIVIFVVLVSLLMAIYFRSWTMSAAALISLAHDLIITVGFFALVQVEVSPATVIGFLTILGYSLYDTVVVFDKVRETTHGVLDQERYTYGELVNLGVNQTLVRSINTSVVALLPVASVLFLGSLLLGAGTLTDISLALFVGMLVGAWSSIFIASPALALMEGHRGKVKAHDQAVLERRAAQEQSGDGKGEPIRVAKKSPGQHLGTSAQPKRKNRR